MTHFDPLPYAIPVFVLLIAAEIVWARRTGHLAGWTHSWREAGYRASGAWGDFSDWLRLGR